jgi:3-oxoacyl-[acyl-carrier protein] reductase
MYLKDKVAVITGSSRGIGAAIALKLASSGANVVINYSSSKSQDDAEKIALKIQDLGQKAIVIKADISNLEEAKQLINESYEKFAKIDILVNNAGITKDTLVLRMKEEDWDRVIDVNLKGVFNCTKSVLKKMLKQHAGKIINLSSVVGIMGNAGQTNYSASKAGIIGFSKSLAREVSIHGITVNVVAPGFIESHMTENLSQKVKDKMLDSIPLNRFGSPEDVANLVSFLASPEADYINGQVINVDGGMLM